MRSWSRSTTRGWVTVAWAGWRLAFWIPWRLWAWLPWATDCDTSTEFFARTSLGECSTKRPTIGSRTVTRGELLARSVVTRCALAVASFSTPEPKDGWFTNGWTPTKCTPWRTTFRCPDIV